MGAVTIATNMAGRGTDIQLGGNVDFRIEDELAELEPRAAEREARRSSRSAPRSPRRRQRVLAAGGLFVLGTERHESRRIDNQLRGRSGRQGDPGLSRFYLSLDDDLLRIFGPQTMFARLMNKNLEDGEAIVSPWISKAIETAQKKVEARNYDIRKQVVEYRRRDERPAQGHLRAARRHHGRRERSATSITDMRAETVNAIVAVQLPAQGTYPEQWDVDGLKESIDAVFGLQPPIDDWLEEEAVDPEMIVERLQELADDSDGGEARATSSRSAGTRSRSRSCSRRSTITGRSISRRSTRCARSSTCAAMRRRSRSTNISRRRSCCSSGCWCRSARK